MLTRDYVEPWAANFPVIAYTRGFYGGPVRPPSTLRKEATPRRAISRRSTASLLAAVSINPNNNFIEDEVLPRLVPIRTSTAVARSHYLRDSSQRR